MKRFKSILVVCDTQSRVEHVFERVRWLSKANEASVELIDVINVDPGHLTSLFRATQNQQADQLADQILEAHRSRLEELAQPLRDEGIDVRCTLRHGTVFLEVIRRVLEVGHDLVIKGVQLGTDGPLFQGSDMHLIRKCPCPVWILKSEADPRATRILAAVDPDPDDPNRDKLNHTVMELAMSLAQQDDASLEVMNVWHLQEESTLRHGLIKIPQSDVDTILNRAEQESAWRLKRLMNDFPDHEDRMRVLHVKGIAADVISQHVHDTGIDTIVMGTVGRTGVAGFFIGNTAETILGRVTCSVLTVKPPSFLSPVVASAASDAA